MTLGGEWNELDKCSKWKLLNDKLFKVTAKKNLKVAHPKISTFSIGNFGLKRDLGSSGQSWMKLLLTQMMSSRTRLGAGGWVSLLWSLLVFISVCRGAAVDAPSQTLTVTSEPSEPSTTVSPSLEDSGSQEASGETGAHPRFARSVAGHDSVLNFDYVGEPDLWSAHKSSHLSRNNGPSSRAGQLPVNSLSESRDPLSRAPTWQLEPQVGKSARGKRVRSGQSSRYRSREQEPEELLAIENSLDAAERGAATTMLSRQQRNGRRYDVPQIGKSYLRSHKSKSNKVSLYHFVIPWVEFDRIIDRVHSHSLKQALVKNNILVQLHTVDLYKIPLKLSGIYLIFLIIQWDPGLFGRYIWSRFTGSNLGPRLLSNIFGISWLWLRRWFSACTANVKPAWAALGQPGHFPWLCPIERLHKTIYLLLA